MQKVNLRLQQIANFVIVCVKVAIAKYSVLLVFLLRIYDQVNVFQNVLLQNTKTREFALLAAHDASPASAQLVKIV